MVPVGNDKLRAKFRLGLVGVGKIACDQHVPAIMGSDRFALVATASPDGAIDQIPAYPDLAALLAAGHDLDAVALCTPPSVRTALAHQALGAGLAVLLEKPPAACASQIAALSIAAKAADRTVMAAWHSRETAAVDAAEAWLKSRRIDAVRVIWREDVRVWHPGQDWLLAAGGFGVFDPVINALSIITRILPEPLALEAARLGIPGNRAAPMTAALTMRHGHAAPVTCDCSILHAGEQQWDIEIDTDAGPLRLTRGGHHLTIDGQAQDMPSSAEYPRIYARFAELINSGQSDIDGRPLTLVSDAFLVGVSETLPDFEF